MKEISFFSNSAIKIFLYTDTERMKVASKIIFLFNDAEGFGSAISDALQPNPSSNLHRKETSFDLSLDKYGIKDCKASGNVVHFIDHQGLYQVSVILLQKYETPVVACVVNEVLASIMGENSSMPTLILPFLVPASKLHFEMKNPTNEDRATVYCTQVGPATDFTQAMVAGARKPPPSLQIHYEPLACLLQLVHVLKLPTVLLIGPKGGHQIKRTSEELEVSYEIGEILASNTGLYFSRDKVSWIPTEKAKDSEEPWRALYG